MKTPVLLAVVTLLVGCASANALTSKTCPPPEIVRVPVPYYVPVDASLTTPLPIAKGGLSDIPAVARERRKALEQANIDRAAIRKMQGTPVPEGK
jgi:type IV pilus biogenesis protein CpaD/CtpE